MSLRVFQVVVCLMLAAGAVGCRGSRWARRDADYRAKYDHHTDNLLRMTKQAIDARHVRGKNGQYAAIVGIDDPAAAGVEIGAFHYGPAYLESRVGLAGMLREGDHPLLAGLNGGLRLQTPSRVAPFVGVNGYLGWAGTEQADDDGRDNNDNGIIDEAGEEDDDYVLALAPETGIHFWLDHKRRLTLSTRYFLSAYGRDDSFWFIGVEYGTFGDAYEQIPSCPPDCGDDLALNYEPDEFPVIPPEPYEAAPPGPYADLVVPADVPPPPTHPANEMPQP